MPIFVRPIRIACFAVILAVMTLCGAAPAWAGDGGDDAGTIQSFLNTVCGFVGIASCPQLPTVTQGTLEIAGLGYARPEAIRRSQNVAPGSVFAGNPPPIPGDPLVPVTLPVSPSAFTNLALVPLAFISRDDHDGDRRGPHALSNGNSFASPTQPFDPAADSFFSAVTTYGNVAGNAQPQVLNLFYDDPSRNNRRFVAGQQVALISLPLVVYDGSACAANPPAGCAETEIMTVLDVRAACNGGASCLTAYAIADFSAFDTQKCRSLMSAQKCTAADLGLGFALVFGASPVSSQPHAIFEVQAPLVVTAANDPVHFSFSSPQTNLNVPPTFGAEDLGFAPAFLDGKVVGVATYPAPVCPGGAPCPTAAPGGPLPSFQSDFGFCASLPDNGNGHRPRPAVAAFLGIATDGEVLASAPLGASTSPTLQCPF